jgi:hypothetical protein
MSKPAAQSTQLCSMSLQQHLSRTGCNVLPALPFLNSCPQTGEDVPMLDTEQQMAAAKQQMEEDLDADAELLGVKRKKKPAAATAAAGEAGAAAAAEGEEGAAAAAAAAGDEELVRALAEAAAVMLSCYSCATLLLQFCTADNAAVLRQCRHSTLAASACWRQQLPTYQLPAGSSLICLYTLLHTFLFITLYAA